MRFCDVGEAKELADMAWKIWMDYYPAIIDREDVEYILNKFQSEEAIGEQIRDGHLYSFIWEKDAKAGYVCIVPEGDSLFMSKIYVSKEFRGTGCGSRAMDEIIEKGRTMRMKRTYLRVNRNNASAIRFYKHKGFIIAAEEKKDVGGGFFLDDYLMEYRY